MKAKPKKKRRGDSVKLTIESTEIIREIDGVPVRVWEGVTDQGGVCYVLVHRIAVPSVDALLTNQADSELEAMLQPRTPVTFQ